MPAGRRRLLGVLVAGMLAATGAGAAGDHVRFVTDVEQAKGHLFSSRELYALGQARRASLHSSHPVQELGNRIVGPVRRVDGALGERVRGLLKKPSRAIDQKVPRPEYDALIDEVYAGLDEAVERVVPAEVRTSRAFQARVIAALLHTLAEEYEEAVKGRKITQIIEYQDAFGFFRRAQALYRTMPEAPKGVAADFDELATAFPSVTPPARAAPPEQLETRAKRIAAALVKSAP